jgi:hypothetical protein
LKKVKVLTICPKRIETTEVSRPIEGSSSLSKPSRFAPVEARIEPAEGPELKKAAEKLKALSPLRETELSKASRIPAATPRRRRMASVLDDVMESVKVPTPALAPDTEGEVLKKSGEAGMAQATSEAGPSVPVEAYPSGAAPLNLEKESVPEKSKSATPEAPTEELEFIVRHDSGKQLSEE